LYRRLAPHAPLRDGPGRYAKFVAQGKGVKLWNDALRDHIYLGDDTFVARMQKRIAVKPRHELARVQHRPAGRSLAHYFAKADSDYAIRQAYGEGGHTQTAIAKATGLAISRMSRLNSRL
jgi:hypothetical protein